MRFAPHRRPPEHRRFRRRFGQPIDQYPHSSLPDHNARERPGACAWRLPNARQQPHGSPHARTRDDNLGACELRLFLGVKAVALRHWPSAGRPSPGGAERFHPQLLLPSGRGRNGACRRRQRHRKRGLRVAHLSRSLASPSRSPRQTSRNPLLDSARHCLGLSHRQTVDLQQPLVGLGSGPFLAK